MIDKLLLAVPAAVLTVLTMATGMVVSSGDAEAARCRRVGFYPNYTTVCESMSTPKPDRPNQQKK